MKQRRLIWKANNDWRFIYSLAKELGKTVSELCEELTVEELLGWIAFNDLEREDLERQKDQTQRASALRTKKR